MQFNSKLYPYQKEILNVFENERNRGEKKIHIVAPPGSGKTIVGLEMVCRIDAPTLILVPNLTLQEQWKNKIEMLFLEENESIEKIVSTNINDIKNINIITYQSLSGTNDESEDIQKKIIDIWFESEKDDFPSREAFTLFVNGLKEENPKEYQEIYGKNRKKLKDSGNSEYTNKLIKNTIHDYVARLKESGVRTMVVDEAHHLTSWWSHVLYEIWNNLEQPYIIGLTATPPFDNADYFELDESYVKLLGTVDYYVPTPAIVKSGRLAPYSDLVYIVSPDETLSALLKEKEQLLEQFLIVHRSEIVHDLHIFLGENFDRLKVKSLDLLEKWIRFVYKYKDTSIDMSTYITKNASQEVTLEDIAKSVGKWASDTFKNTKKTIILDEVKTLFFDLGYIWRGTNLYRFETPIEKGLIYSKSKLEGVYPVLDKEIENMGDSLRVAIITDFLDMESDWINGHYIFDAVSRKYAHLNPYLVSGQGIWKIENNKKILAENETILSVTEKLSRGETKIVIGTRGILGEGWDCPPLNTLIDLTGVSAYMSVNQVHGRAIRLNLENPEKVANIYDIVCTGEGFQGRRDFNRLERKHTQFYGVDDSGLIIKELDHIYPQLEKFITNKERINAYTLRKSSLRAMTRELWNIGSDFQNEEVFSLSIEIQNPFSEIYIPNNASLEDISITLKEKEGNINLLELGKSTYHAMIRRWISELIGATLQVMKPFGIIPEDFNYTMQWSDSGSIKVTGNHRDQLINKKFLEIISPMFSAITDEKYVLKYEKKQLFDATSSLIMEQPYLVIILFLGAFIPLLVVNLEIMLKSFTLYGIIVCSILFIIWILHFRKKARKIQAINNSLSILDTDGIQIGLPDIISSNEEKRGYFLGGKFPSIPEEARWFSWIGKHILDSRICLLLIVMVLFCFFEILFIWDIIPTRMENTILEEIYFSVFITGGILCGISGIIYIIHAFYSIFAKRYNYLQKKKVITIPGNITPTTQENVGKKTLLTGKIEKLWI